MKKLFLLIASIALMASACGNQSVRNSNQDTVPSPTPANRAFDNNLMSITLEEQWNASPIADTNAVNITKDNFTLYINPEATQASGVEGGRFAEIAQGSPSADVVIAVQPSGPCGTAVQTSVNTNLLREDLFVATTDKTDFCNVPKNDKTVWYFSYIRRASKQGYFNYYTSEPTKAYVITMSYQGKEVDKFPEQGSSELEAALRDMTMMVQSLQLTYK